MGGCKGVVICPFIVRRQRSNLMAHLKSLVVVILIVVASSAVRAKAQPIFSRWLGPQTNENSTLFAPVSGKPIDPTKHDKLPRYEFSLEIVKGGDLKLPVSENAIVTFDGKEFRQTKDFAPDEEATYLFCRMQLKKGELGWRFYTFNVRVTDGVLEGAVVHFRDGRIQGNITDPCIAIYRIPDDIEVETGTVPFEIVALFAK